MMNETKWQERAQAENMSFFSADICYHSLESYTFEEKKRVATSGVVFDAICEGEPNNGRRLVCYSPCPSVLSGSSASSGSSSTCVLRKWTPSSSMSMASASL